MTTSRWAPAALAFLLVAVPLAQASGDNGGNLGCLNVVTSTFTSGIRPVLSISDAIAVGLQTNVPTEVGLVLIVVPALCHLPSVGDVIGETSHTSRATPDLDAGQPIVP